MEKTRILIVEDEAITARNIEGMLKRSGYMVPATASSGKEAIQQAEKTDLDLVIMDIKLRGEIDGIEAAEKIRSRFDLPVIYLTVYGDEMTLKRAKTTEPYGYILKPFEIGDLKSSIEIALYRKKMEIKIRKSEEQFRTSVENMLDCFGIYSAMRDKSGQIVDFRVEYVNAAACRNNRMTKEQQIGKGLCEKLPAHRELGLFDEYCQVVETGKPFSKESLIYQDAYEMKELTRAFDIRAAKMGDGFVAAWRDITDRVQVEEALREIHDRYQSLLESSEDIVYLIDRDIRYVYANTGLLKRFGLSLDEVVGEHYEKFHTAEGAKEFAEKIKQVFDSAKSVSYEHQSHRDGRYFLRTLSPITDERTLEVVEVAVISKDITERKEVEEQIERGRLELQRLSRKLICAQEDERKRISRELHDEMGQALTGMRINLAEIEKKLPEGVDAKTKERLLDTISLVGLTSERMRELAFELRPTMLDDLGLIPTLRWYLDTYAKRLGIDVDFKVVDIEEPLAPEMETVLYRVAQEALTNIARHAKANTVRLYLRCEDSAIVMSIEDDGIGFNSEEILKREDPDPGIGLVGIRERAVALGGRFDVKSRPGKGTHLYFEVPKHSRDYYASDSSTSG